MRFLALSLLLLGSACTGDAPEAPDTISDDSAEVEGFGGEIRGSIDAVATNTGDEVEIGVTDEVMFFRLTDAARGEVRKEVDSEVPEEGLGAAIGEMVSGVVSQALATTVQIDLADIDDVRYEDGHLIVESGERGRDFSFSDDDENGLRFDADDAQRIIDAFERNR